jgi:heme exporter protein C
MSATTGSTGTSIDDGNGSSPIVSAPDSTTPAASESSPPASPQESSTVPASGSSPTASVSERRARQARVVGWLGITAAVSLAVTVWLGLWVTPPDRSQGNLVRLLYLHPPIAWVALYLAFGLAALSSLLYLWRRTRSFFWDRVAAASVEIGVVFNALTLVTGSLWGRPTWGVWWTWDARLTSTALLLVLFLGYLALRRVPADPEVRAKRCAVAALVAFVDVPIVHFSVVWWQTLHQGATVLNANLSPTVHGSMAWTLLLGFVAMTLVFAWMVAVRYRIELLADELDGEELEISLAERRAEGAEGAERPQVDQGVSAP